MVKLISWIYLAVFSACFASCTVEAELTDDAISNLAESICSNPTQQYVELKSVEDTLKVINYLQKVTYDSKLGQCRKRYILALNHLELVIGGLYDNACDGGAIQQADDFYTKYLSTTKKDLKDQKKEKFDVPQVFKTFFLHYIYQVSLVCKQALLDNLAVNSLKIVSPKGESIDTRNLDNLLNDFSDSISDMSATDYTSLYLPWKILDTWDLRKSSRKYLKEVIDDCSWDSSGQCTRISIKMRLVNNILQIQRMCSKYLRPVYSKQILPIVHLIGMGMYDRDEPLAKELSSNEDLRRMIRLTQMCETHLAIEVFQDVYLERNRVVALTLNEANELRKTKHLPSVEDPPYKVLYKEEFVNPGMGDLNVLDSLGNAESTIHLSEKLIQNRKEQEQILDNIRTQFKERVKSHMKSKFGHLFSLKKSNNDSEVTSVEIPDKNASIWEKMKKIGKWLLVGLVGFVILAVVISAVAINLGLLAGLFG